MQTSTEPSSRRTPAAAELRQEEYRALRATIRERGTARIVAAIASVALWASLLVAVQYLVATPFGTLIPLIVLALGFEAVFALHVGVERVGRYLQVFYENGGPEGPAWEATAMRLGEAGPAASGAVDPLFAATFILAAMVNFTPVLLATLGVDDVAGRTAELIVYGAIHLAFLVRVFVARAFSASQRQRDLARFEALRDRGTG